MPFEFFQIRCTGECEAKDSLNKLLRGGRIASVRKEFVADGENSFWAFCVESVDGKISENKAPGNSARPAKVDYKEVLSEADFAVFSKLREMRKAISEKEAIPAYSVFTNEQLSHIVKARPDSLSSLGKVEGVGESRVQKYGGAVMDVLASEKAKG
jgi:superfamily II DNA helicase RecQ